MVKLNLQSKRLGSFKTGNIFSLNIPEVGLRRFFASHARTSHVQIQVRTHTCAHANSLVVALCTRTRTFSKFYPFKWDCFKIYDLLRKPELYIFNDIPTLNKVNISLDIRCITKASMNKKRLGHQQNCRNFQSAQTVKN